MMSLHMIIDIDHMSGNLIQDVFNFTNDSRYPLMSGHSTLMGPDHNAENARTVEQYKQIALRKGLTGLNIDTTVEDFIETTNKILELNISIGIGSDCNGLVKLPGVPSSNRVKYSADFPRCKTGNMTWDYNSDGMAHIGLLPDYLRDVESMGGKNILQKLFLGVEAFAQAWEICEKYSPERLAMLKSMPKKEYNKMC